MTPLQCICARAILGWSLDDLAERSHLSATAIARFERGETNLIKLARLTIENLFDQANIRFAAYDDPKAFCVHYLHGAEAEHVARCKAEKEARRQAKAREAAATATAAPTPATSAPPASASPSYREARETPTIPIEGDAWDFLDEKQ